MLAHVDKANGYVFAGLAAGNKSPYPPEFIYGAACTSDRDLWADMQDRCAGLGSVA